MDERFAGMLDAAIARSREAQGEPRLIEASHEQGSSRPAVKSPAEVSSERIGRPFVGLRRRV